MSGIMSIVLFPGNIFATYASDFLHLKCMVLLLHTLSGNCIDFYVHFSKIVQHGDK